MTDLPNQIAVGPARSAFLALEAAYLKARPTFATHLTTTAKQNEALRLLSEIEAQAKAARVLLRQSKAAVRKLPPMPVCVG